MKRNVLLNYVFQAVFFFYVDIALWPIYLTKVKGFSLVDLAVFQVVWVVSKLIFEIPSGIFSDKIGRVRTLAVAATAAIFSNLFILIGKSFLVISFSYILFGISRAFVSGTNDAFLFDSLKALNREDEYKRINTDVYIWTMISFIVAMILGGFLSNINMNLMYIANIIAFTAALVICIFLQEPPLYIKGSNSINDIVHNSINIFKFNKNLLYLIIFLTFTETISNTTWDFSQKMFSDMGLSVMNISAEAIFTTMACAFVAKIGYYTERKSGKTVSSIITTIMLLVPLIILGHINNIYLSIVVLTLTTTAISFARPIYSSYINEEVESSYRATILSTQSFIQSAFALSYVAILGLTSSINKSFIFIGILAIPVYIFILYKMNSAKKGIPEL